MGKILAILFWLCSICQIWRLYSESNTRFYEQSVPMILFTAILFFYWGRILWKGDDRKIAINGWLMTLMIVGIFIVEIFACMFIGVTISDFMANGSPVVGNWVFMILMTFCLYNLAPSKILPKRFFIEDSNVEPIKSIAEKDDQNLQQEESEPNSNCP